MSQGGGVCRYWHVLRNTQYIFILHLHLFPNAGFVQYVRLLVNEEPQEIGLCKDTQQAIEEDQLARDHSLCKLDVLKERAYKATHGFSPLTELCQEPL